MKASENLLELCTFKIVHYYLFFVCVYVCVCLFTYIQIYDYVCAHLHTT